MDDNWVQHIRKVMEAKSNGELLKIWEENRAGYLEETFEAIKQLLMERGIALPAQKGNGDPVVELARHLKGNEHKSDDELRKDVIDRLFAQPKHEGLFKKIKFKLGCFFDIPFDINNVFTKDVKAERTTIFLGLVIGISVADFFMGYSRLLNGILGAIGGIIGVGTGCLLWIVFGKK